MEDNEKPEQIDPQEQILNDAIDILLLPYEPVDHEIDADTHFTTAEIIGAVERHYGVPQGSTDFHTMDAGLKVVQKLQQMGYKFINTGGLQLQWIMARRNP